MDISNQPNQTIIKLFSIGAVSLALNYLINTKLLQKPKNTNQTQQKTHIINQALQKEKEEIESLSHKKSPACIKKEQCWGSVKLINIDQTHPLLKELKMMDSLLFEVSRVNHLIVDLELKDFKPYPNHLVNHSVKKNKEEPFLSAGTILAPGEFILKQSKFTPSNTLELEKKYLRAGPRATDFFNPKEVRADIVCLGGVCPGINTVIREIVLMLKNVSKVDRVTGVKNSLKGYYNSNFIDLNEQNVQTIHHHGGCFLGLAKSDFNVNKIVDSLVDRNVNQLYIIGAKKAMDVCQSVHKEIKKRRLAIAVCVLLKGIDRDIPIFDSCFGFETAVEESSKVIEKAYAFSHSQENAISLVKLHGYNSGFLASYAVLSTVNANVCLVPEFEFDMYGPKGLLEYLFDEFRSIMWRIRNKGSCTIVYADGTEKSIRDCVIRKNGSSNTKTEFDNFMLLEIERKLKEEGVKPFTIGMFNGIEIARTSPANAIDTKLCWELNHNYSQISQSSVMGMMSGYTNFAIGHLSSKSTMISVDELICSEIKTELKEHDNIWQQTVMSTGQPRLINDSYVIKTP